MYLADLYYIKSGLYSQAVIFLIWSYFLLPYIVLYKLLILCDDIIVIVNLYTALISDISILLEYLLISDISILLEYFFYTAYL